MSRGFTLISKACKGFTLIELLVVISIIGVLMGIGFVAFKQAQAAGRDAKRKADIRQIAASLRLFREDCGYYPSALDLNQSSFTAQCSTSDPTVTYLDKIPQDPLSPQYAYRYEGYGTKTLFFLCAYMEKGPYKERDTQLVANGNVPAGCWNGLAGRWNDMAVCGTAVCNYNVISQKND